MLGCGEEKEEVVGALRALRDAGVDVVTLGQYMRPTKKHMAVSQYITPEAFAAYQEVGGFEVTPAVACSHHVRSQGCMDQAAVNVVSAEC
jgi:lipoate synthase